MPYMDCTSCRESHSSPLYDEQRLTFLWRYTGRVDHRTHQRCLIQSTRRPGMVVERYAEVRDDSDREWCLYATIAEGPGVDIQGVLNSNVEKNQLTAFS